MTENESIPNITESQPLSLNNPNRVTGWRRAIAGATTFTAIATGAGAISPSSAEAASPQLFAPGAGESISDPNAVYCAPDFTAEHPELLSAAQEKVIINFTDQDGREISVLLPVCPREGENQFPTDPDEARKLFMKNELGIDNSDSFYDPFEKKMLDINMLGNLKTKKTDSGTYLGSILEIEKRGKDYLILVGALDKKGKPFTYIQTLDGNFDGNMAFEHVTGKVYDSSKLQIGRVPVKITDAAETLERHLGEIFMTISFIKPINIDVPYFDKGLAKVAKSNNSLFDFILAKKNGKHIKPNVLGINSPLSDIKNSQINKLPSAWGIIAQDINK